METIEILGSSTEEEQDDQLQDNFHLGMQRTLFKQEILDQAQAEDSQQEDYLELLREVEDSSQATPCEEQNDDYFVDLTTWPTTVGNISDALAKYNDIGLLKKIQFKKMSRRINDEGFMTSFTICCAKRSLCKKDSTLSKGVKIKESTRTKCPVKV